MTVILGLMDTLFKKMNSKQSEVLYYKLCGFSENEIADKMGIRQASVNQHSTALGWNAIEQAVRNFETLKF